MKTIPFPSNAIEATGFPERADANARVMSLGYVWNQDEGCWITNDGKRCVVRWSDRLQRYYLSSVL